MRVCVSVCGCVHLRVCTCTLVPICNSSQLLVYSIHVILLSYEFFCHALLSPELEKGSRMDQSHSQTRLADIVVPSWSMGEAAACDVTFVHLLNLRMISGACTTAGFAAAHKVDLKSTCMAQKNSEKQLNQRMPFLFSFSSN